MKTRGEKKKQNMEKRRSLYGMRRKEVPNIHQFKASDKNA